MKLKTLKDIDLGLYDDACICGHYIKEHEWYVGEKNKKQPCTECNCKDFKTPHDNLKQEVIKWVKEICKDGFNKCPTITVTGEKGQLMKALIKAESSLVADWIKHFFNITEEDLK